MKFICEVCKTQYNKMEDAEACEIQHKKSAQEEKTYIDEINRLANEYISKYRKMPLIEVSEDNQPILRKDKFFNHLNLFF